LSLWKISMRRKKKNNNCVARNEFAIYSKLEKLNEFIVRNEHDQFETQFLFSLPFHFISDYSLMWIIFQLLYSVFTNKKNFNFMMIITLFLFSYFEEKCLVNCVKKTLVLICNFSNGNPSFHFIPLYTHWA
jgi:hypothetical protein